MYMNDINDKIKLSVFDGEQMKQLRTPIELVSQTESTYFKFEFTVEEAKKLLSALQGALDG